MEPEGLENKRFCYCVFIDQFDDDGFIPSAVFEGVAGHFPMTGSGQLAAPWHWGKTFKEAENVAEEMNKKRGLTPLDCFKIIASSMNKKTKGEKR